MQLYSVEKKASRFYRGWKITPLWQQVSLSQVFLCVRRCSKQTHICKTGRINYIKQMQQFVVGITNCCNTNFSLESYIAKGRQHIQLGFSRLGLTGLIHG